MGQMKLRIDGTLPDGTLGSDGARLASGPWFVFDEERPDWVSGPHRCWWMASRAKQQIEREG